MTESRKLPINTLATYIDEAVVPALEDFEREYGQRRAFVAAVVAYHAIDRAAQDLGRKSVGNLRKEWWEKSKAFEIIDVVAHKFKHVKNPHEDRKQKDWGEVLTIGDVLQRMRMVDFLAEIKDVIRFLRCEAERIERPPALRLQSSRPK